jgi:hypothetical protein
MSERDPPVEKVRTSLSQEVEFIFDPMQFNKQRNEAIIPVRLKNTSRKTLYGPITVEVKNLTDPIRVVYGYLAPRVMNAANGKTGVGAIFDYSLALRDF